MERVHFRDCHLLRLLCFVILPLLLLIFCGLRPNGYITGLVITIGIYIVLCASLNLLNGFSGMFSMGHAAFMAIGAYISAFLTLGSGVKANQCPSMPEWLVNLQLPFGIALVVGGLAAAVIAVIVCYPVLRTRGHYLSVVTLALIVIIRALIDNLSGWTNGARGLTGLPADSNIVSVYVCVVVTLFILYRLLRTAYGRGLIGMRDDPVAAQTLGVNLSRKKLSAFAISAFFAGVGGGLWGHYLTVISGQNFYFTKSFDIVEISIIGGMSSLSGSILGSIFFVVVPELLAPLESGIRIGGLRLPTMYGLSSILMAIFLILLIIFRRQGLMGRSELVLDTWFSRDTYTAPFRKEEYQKLGRLFSRK